MTPKPFSFEGAVSYHFQTQGTGQQQTTIRTQFADGNRGTKQTEIFRQQIPMQPARDINSTNNNASGHHPMPSISQSQSHSRASSNDPEPIAPPINVTPIDPFSMDLKSWDEWSSKFFPPRPPHSIFLPTPPKINLLCIFFRYIKLQHQNLYHLHPVLDR
jgi:hypothetical protein